MKYNIVPFLITLCFSFICCNQTFQYGVNVINSTNKTLRIEYKSLTDLNDKSHQIIKLKPKEFKRIIWTENIANTGSMFTDFRHCKYVAEYVNAYNFENKKSKIEWCSYKTRFEKTDIQQAEFYIEYTENDF